MTRICKRTLMRETYSDSFFGPGGMIIRPDGTTLKVPYCEHARVISESDGISYGAALNKGYIFIGFYCSEATIYFEFDLLTLDSAETLRSAAAQIGTVYVDEGAVTISAGDSKYPPETLRYFAGHRWYDDRLCFSCTGQQFQTTASRLVLRMKAQQDILEAA